MMTNLFSTFDPSSIFHSSINWMSASIFIMFFPLLFWLIPSRMNIMWNNISMKLNNELKMLLSNNNIPGMPHIFFSLFMFLLFNNFMGLFPYVFTSTSHLVMTLSLALTLWISLMFYGWFKNTMHMFAHLLPQSTPLFLMSFMVIIETTSNIIRPLTLSVRLMANMMAGHLLLTLLGNLNLNSSYLLMSMILITQILLLTLETAVSMIQAYVFMILSSLYTSETS